MDTKLNDLCKLCRSTFDNLPSLPAHITASFPIAPGVHALMPYVSPQQPQRFGRPHHRTPAALAQSAPACPLCAAIHAGVSEFTKNLINARQRGGVPMFFRLPEAPGEYGLQITRREHGQDGFAVWTDGKPGESTFLVATVGYCVDGDSPLASQFSGRVVDEDASSPRTLRVALDWVQKCNTAHKHCNPGHTPLPTRVLDVRNGTIRLWETNSAHGSYTTLSHCWGDPTATPPFTTTRANIAQRKRRIAPPDMPKTFRDAVALTRALGIAFLWIDSLCICQGDRRDWEVEASRMAEVYANSYLTIAAAGARDGSVGCLARRPRRTHHAFGYTAPGGATGAVHAFLVPVEKARFIGEYQLMRDEPLSARAWTTQERMLSPRTLFFASDQMYYECNESFLSEDGARIAGRYLGVDAPRGAPDDPAHTHTHRHLRALWDGLMDFYGSRKLTVASDKLPALSGLAKRVEQQLGDTYVAGLWGRTLLADLLWQTSRPGGAWPPEYRAPSWSWLSVDGAEGASERMRGCPKLASVLAYDVRVAGENPYGEVDGAWIRLRAPLVRVCVAGVGEDGRFYFTAGDCDAGGKRMNAILDYDIDCGRLGALELFGLLVGRDAPTEDQVFYMSLLVTPMDGGEGRHEYRRLSMFAIEEESLGAFDPTSESNYSVVTLF